MDALESLLGGIPEHLRTPLLEEYGAAYKAWHSRDWEKVGLKAGKVCEIVFSVVDGLAKQDFPSAPYKPKNFVVACQSFERTFPSSTPRSLRIQIPKILIAMYELRNNRAIGHVSGDISANHMDGEYFFLSIRWLLAELVRYFNGMNIEEAADAVELIVERHIPPVWTDGTVVRVLDHKMSAKDKTLLVLYFLAKPIADKELQEHVEYKNISLFRTRILTALHREKLIEYSIQNKRVLILPPGMLDVEKRLSSL